MARNPRRKNTRIARFHNNNVNSADEEFRRRYGKSVQLGGYRDKNGTGMATSSSPSPRFKATHKKRRNACYLTALYGDRGDDGSKSNVRAHYGINCEGKRRDTEEIVARVLASVRVVAREKDAAIKVL